MAGCIFSFESLEGLLELKPSCFVSWLLDQHREHLFKPEIGVNPQQILCKTSNHIYEHNSGDRQGLDEHRHRDHSDQPSAEPSGGDLQSDVARRARSTYRRSSLSRAEYRRLFQRGFSY
ncbi:unnamed protein product [Prunus armeniaca]|uniref:Uncharacterized protein n=1 Tax=Prunus armeniaca TaxID=36596 RepID=A0A6J5UML0_PRUAR|nr:unnamed protein product [Prunus armeniaca]